MHLQIQTISFVSHPIEKLNVPLLIIGSREDKENKNRELAYMTKSEEIKVLGLGKYSLILLLKFVS